MRARCRPAHRAAQAHHAATHEGSRGRCRKARALEARVRHSYSAAALGESVRTDRGRRRRGGLAARAGELFRAQRAAARVPRLARAQAATRKVSPPGAAHHAAGLAWLPPPAKREGPAMPCSGAEAGMRRSSSPRRRLENDELSAALRPDAARRGTTRTPSAAAAPAGAVRPALARLPPRALASRAAGRITWCQRCPWRLDAGQGLPPSLAAHASLCIEPLDADRHHACPTQRSQALCAAQRTRQSRSERQPQGRPSPLSQLVQAG